MNAQKLDEVLEALDNVTENQITPRNEYKDNECKVCFNGLIAQVVTGCNDLSSYAIMQKLDSIYENVEFPDPEDDDYMDNITREKIDDIHSNWTDGEISFTEAIDQIKEYLKENE